MAKGDESREKILLAAGKIFAEKGLAGASVRAITSAAGVNHALIGYYFGSKVALYQEVLERAARTMGIPRVAKLDQLRTTYGEQPIPLRELMDAYIRPFFDQYGQPGSLASTWLRFYGRCFTELDDEVRETTNRSGSPLRSVFLKELQRTLPDHSKRELVYRLGATIGTITFWRAETGIMDDHLESEADVFDVDDLIDQVVDMCCAAFLVPPRDRSGKADTAECHPEPSLEHNEPQNIESPPENKRSRRHRRRTGTAG